jgi:hypothetical protein
MKRYNIDRVINNRWAVWYMEIPHSRNKLGVWKIIDLFPGTRPTKYIFRWKVKGAKTQEVFDEQLINGCIRNFYRNKNQFLGTKELVTKN